ncbi:Flagellar L-ring protein FlgH [hydrothermal vent metagenome]|uniref:Flagellar L-ring protein FlgH n=1 Tax=hydrothermal vent metagenome TaxID=652676 RepID=A0A3B0Y028_9ZZZZ
MKTRTIKKLIRIFIILLLASGLAACGGGKINKKENFDATPPPEVKIKKVVNGSIYQDSTAIPLYEDRKAYRVGDILTVVLNESTNATKSATTSTSKEGSNTTGITSILGSRSLVRATGIGNNNINSAHDFSGKGDSAQSNKITGTIAVTIHNVMSNGNLQIRGQKRLLLNQGVEFIKISGMVRPSDITSTNSVQSTQVANAKIIYSGKGAVADSNSMGILARFFNSKLWPF